MKRLTTLIALLALGGASVAQAQSQQVASANQPAAPAPAETTFDVDYRLGPEDVIGVFVWKEPDLSTSVMVRPDGRLSLPLVDEIEVAGRTPGEVRELIVTALSRYIDRPVVSVFIEEINSPKISVLGEVRLPGRYNMRQRITLIDAIAMAGGFTEFAKRDSVAIVRAGRDGVQRIEVDLEGVLRGRTDRLPELRANDAVYVQ